MTAAFSRYWTAALQFWRALAELWAFALALLGIRGNRVKREKKVKPWMVVLRRQGSKVAKPEFQGQRGGHSAPAGSDEGAGRRVGANGKGGRIRGRFGRLLADPREVERIIEALVRENSPFLHIARERPAEGEGTSPKLSKELVLRETDVLIHELITLFVPRFGVENMESRRPPGYPVVRAARSLSDLRAVPMLYLSVPEDIVFARLVEGSLPILAYREERKTILFQAEQHIIERRERRRNHVEIEIESGGSGNSTRLMYMLLDRSTSLVHNCAPRGSNAVMELAIAAAMIRSDMGRPHARYYFRAFADGMDPKRMDPPLSATTVQEKDWLVSRLMKTNFSGDATRVVDALEQAIEDIERIVESGELGQNVKPRIGLLTDGRFTLYGGIGSRLKRMGIEMDTVLIGREAARNPDLISLSSSVSLVDPELYRAARAA